MANRIEQARAAVDACIREAYLRAAAALDLPEGADVRGSVEQPKDTANGDFAANHAMASAKTMHMAPRKIAEALIAHMDLDGTWFASVEAAGPGFLNFRLSDKWYQDVLTAVDDAGADYGRVDDGHGEKVMVEFVSANPTGPMTIGNARGGVLGDALASVLDRAGYNVWREFYVNDAGNQVDLFGKSIEARYLQLIQGEDAVVFPDNGYHGDDIKELARLIYERDGDKYLTVPSAERCAAFVAFGLPYNIARMQRDLERYRIHFDQWFLESSLHSSGYVAETVQLLVDAGLTYEKDGALWLRNTDLGADKDEVLRRSNGFYTYYAVDIAYHRNKFIERGFDRVIDVWGADHHGHAIRFAATMRAPALGLEGRKLDFLIMQMVRLMRGDEKAGQVGGDGGGDGPAAAPHAAGTEIDRQHVECRLGRAEHDGGGAANAGIGAVGADDVARRGQRTTAAHGPHDHEDRRLRRDAEPRQHRRAQARERVKRPGGAQHAHGCQQRQ